MEADGSTNRAKLQWWKFVEKHSERCVKVALEKT